MPAPIEVVELTPDRVDDYFALFDNSFPDNPDWAGCYCGFHDDTSARPWENVQDAIEHRAAREARIRSRAASGLLAYVDDQPVGWCNVALRSRYDNLRRYAEAVVDPAEDPALIMCFVITPQQRGRGVATALVRGAITAAQGWGAPWLEAYPAKPEQDTDPLPWTAASYKGPLSMYERAGFRIARDMGTWLVVRHELGAARSS
jgi:GNAT superfamily N-acetyltransferase